MSDSLSPVAPNAGMVQGTVMVAMQNAVERSEIAAVSSGLGFANKLFSAVGIASSGAVLSAAVRAGGFTLASLDDSVEARTAYAHGMQLLLFYQLLPGAIAALVFLALPDQELSGALKPLDDKLKPAHHQTERSLEMDACAPSNSLYVPPQVSSSS
jgi:hypothetical protein